MLGDWGGGGYQNLRMICSIEGDDFVVFVLF